MFLFTPCLSVTVVAVVTKVPVLVAPKTEPSSASDTTHRTPDMGLTVANDAKCSVVVENITFSCRTCAVVTGPCHDAGS